MEVLPSLSTSRRPRTSTPLPSINHHHHLRQTSTSTPTSNTPTFRFLTASTTSSSPAWFKLNFLTPRQRKEIRRTLSQKLFHLRKTISARKTYLALLLLLLLLFALFRFLLFALRSNDKLITRQQRLLYQTLTSPPPPLSDSIVHPQNPNITICNSTNNCTTWPIGKYSESDLQRLGVYRDVRTVEVPLGVTAYFYPSQEGKLPVPFYSGKHLCEGNLVCGKLTRLDVEAGLGQFLNYLEALGTVSNVDELARQEEIVYAYPAQTSFDVWDVTLIAQFSVNRLQRFEKLIDNWPGSLSAVIYLTEPSDANELVQYLRNPLNVERYSRVILTIVRPKYDRRGAHRTYPINRLRNLGISASASDYYLVVDADFVPSPNLQSYATNMSRSSLLDHHPSSRKPPTALVIPCVAIPESYQGPYPQNVSDLSTLMSQKIAYVTDPLAGHGPTFTTEILTETPLLTSRPYYEVCYETQWEPYYVLHKPTAPRYDERFTNQGGDKQSHALLLNSLRYRFYVARDHFLYHLDHKNMIWPGGATFGIRDSVVGVPESDDDEEIQGGTLGTADDPFSSSSKKKKIKKKAKTRRFGYFSDTLSEVETLFGLFYAWPRGCGHPFVHTQRIAIGGGLASGLF